MATDPLAPFPPLVRDWFRSRYGEPTAVQAATWERIAAGGHVLALAPTGSGKTLAAFLEAIGRIAAGYLPADRLSVLYVSPLKALAEDIRRNLEEPINTLCALATARGEAFPEIRVATRSGDTPEAERRRFLSRPPAILCTTPESLAILLDSPRARPVLESIRLLVIDEVHALAGEKRGALLACSVGRLALLAGEFQRVALSATARPAELIAAWVGGLRIEGEPGTDCRLVPRPVAIVAPPSDKKIEFLVEWPEPAAFDAAAASLPGGAPGSALASLAAARHDADHSRHAALVPAIVERIRANRSVLVFCDARRRAERLAFLLNEAAGEGIAWAHHGSLSREARLVVEERLKRGELPCVVATATLELGIDVGAVGEVLLAGTPPGVAEALQRAGRSGHAVGETSRARIYPFHGLDLLLAAAVVEGAGERAVEELRPPRCPLDILAQALLSLSAEGPRHRDALYDIIRSFPPFEGLPRSLFDSTLALLAGRHADGRLRELEPRVFLDAVSGIVRAREGTRPLLWSSGGAIPDRGLYAMRLKGAGTRIGELDEEFVWERKAGDAFTLGTQAWRIVAIGAEAVEVSPLGRGADFMPFWKGECRNWKSGTAQRVLSLLDRLEPLDQPGRAVLLEAGHSFSRQAALEAARFLSSQEAAQSGTGLPGTRRALLETYADPSLPGAASRGGTWRVVLHDLRGGAVNRPLALVIAAAWEEAGELPLSTSADDEGILLLVPEAGEEGEGAAARLAALLRSLGDRKHVERLLRSRLEGSGLFAARFRENAGRALLIPRARNGKRTPLWITRLRARRLYEAVRGAPDFPVIAETWRGLLAEEFDLEGLSDFLSGLADGVIVLESFRTRTPSPLGRAALWRETNEFLYRGDDLGGGPSTASDAAIAAALSQARLRPRLDPALVDDFAQRVKRLVPGWAPATPEDLAEWARERVAIPADELPAILASSPTLAEALAADPGAGGRLCRLTFPGATLEVLVHAERKESLLAALRDDPVGILAEWLRREGAVEPERMATLFGISGPELDACLAGLAEDGGIVIDALVRGSDAVTAIDAENLEVLLRMSRRAARPRVEARPAGDLFRLVMAVQGFPAPRANPREALDAALESLAGWPAPAWLWEAELLPARVPGYDPAFLDASFAAGRLAWFGAGREILALAEPEELELFLEAGKSSSLPLEEGELLDFWKLRERAGLPSRELALSLWADAWAGGIAADSFSAIRGGIAMRFGKDLTDPAAARDGTESGAVGIPSPFGRTTRRVPRALRDRWKTGAPVAGSWYRLELGPGEADALDLEALERERVRVLARRYGILCRDLLSRELPALSWGRLFGAMRRMELAGELLAGRFFEGVDGPQFMGVEAFSQFNALDDTGAAGGVSSGSSVERTVAGEARGASSPGTGGVPDLWLNALDPASPAGFPFEERSAILPARARENRIFLDAGRVIAIAQRGGREFRLATEPGDPRMAEAARAWAALRDRPAWAVATGGRRMTVETIDGLRAADSPHAAAFLAAGFAADRGRLVLW